jgi:integrase
MPSDPNSPKLAYGIDEASTASILREVRKHKTIAAFALEFTVLTAARTGEVVGATWAEFDLDKAVWTVPACRMKAGMEHRVPLSPRALDILRKMKDLGGAWVFPASKGRQLSGMAMAMLLRQMHPDVTVHGFRSIFRDWAANCTAHPHEVCEMALAHTTANKAEAAYRRSDFFEERRRLLEDWADYCACEGVIEAQNAKNNTAGIVRSSNGVIRQPDSVMAGSPFSTLIGE